jgi:uncharacterized protein YlaI
MNCRICDKHLDDQNEVYPCVQRKGIGIFLCRECFYAMAIMGVVKKQEDKWVIEKDKD